MFNSITKMTKKKSSLSTLANHKTISDARRMLPLAELKILMVEDDPFLRDLYQRIFDRASIKVELARDGEEGFDVVKAQKPDLMLLDVMLPGITGPELLSKMAKELEYVPMVIMLSDLDQIGVKDKCINLGAKAFISKNDVSGPELLRKVEEILKA